MFDEPRKHRIYLILLTLSVVGSVPFLFVGRPQVAFLGLPAWLWWSFTFTLAISCVTAWGLLKYWHGGDDE